MMTRYRKKTIFAGHYGSGKSNLAVAAALELAAFGSRTALVDMDVVNPYFHSGDFEEELRGKGVEVVRPLFSGTNVEAVTLSPRVRAAFADPELQVVSDVGGDDAGAVALGQYAAVLRQTGYDMWLVVNFRRPLTRRAEQLLDYIADMQAASRLSFTGIVNNTNLGEETTPWVVADSVPEAEKLVQLTGLPLVFTAARSDIARQLDIPGVYPFDIHTREWF